MQQIENVINATTDKIRSMSPENFNFQTVNLCYNLYLDMKNLIENIRRKQITQEELQQLNILLEKSTRNMYLVFDKFEEACQKIQDKRVEFEMAQVFALLDDQQDDQQEDQQEEQQNDQQKNKCESQTEANQ